MVSAPKMFRYICKLSASLGEPQKRYLAESVTDIGISGVKFLSGYRSDFYFYQDSEFESCVAEKLPISTNISRQK